MRKIKSAGNSFIIALSLLAVAASFFMTSCAKAPKKEQLTKAEKEQIVEIKEKMFISQVSDVYSNADDYLGKTIKLEGLFKEEQGYDKSYCFVLRYGPGCCGYDGNVGFEVVWDNEQAKPYPAVDSWVEAVGVLKSYEEDGPMQYLYLDLASLNVLSKRGAEKVAQ
jgi:putative membrane protein